MYCLRGGVEMDTNMLGETLYILIIQYHEDMCFVYSRNIVFECKTCTHVILHSQFSSLNHKYVYILPVHTQYIFEFTIKYFKHTVIML